jgi:hypothetical protein
MRKQRQENEERRNQIVGGRFHFDEICKIGGKSAGRRGDKTGRYWKHAATNAEFVLETVHAKKIRVLDALTVDRGSTGAIFNSASVALLHLSAVVRKCTPAAGRPALPPNEEGEENRRKESPPTAGIINLAKLMAVRKT